MNNQSASSKSEQRETTRYELSTKNHSPRLRLLKHVLKVVLLLIIVFVVYYLFFGGQEALKARFSGATEPSAESVTMQRPATAPAASSESAGGSPSTQPNANASGDAATAQPQQSSGGPSAGGPPAGGPPAGGPGGMRGGMSTKVSVVKVEERPMNFIISGLGTAVPSETVVVRSQVSGPLVKIFFEEGAAVEAGAPLFEIDQRPFVANLQQAQGQYQQNEAQLANAEADLRRYQTLFKQNSIARQQVDTQAALVNQLKASRASLQAQVDQASLELEYTTVKAPIGGRLGLRSVDIGNLIQANASEGLVTITQNQPMDVEFAISELHVPRLSTRFYQGESIEVRLYDRNSSQYLGSGYLLSMDNQIDLATGTVKVKGRFDNANYRLFPHQFVNARLVVERHPSTLALMTDAVQFGRAGPYVFVVADDMTIEQRPIVTGIVDGEHTQVLEGLLLDEQVVIEGIDRLRIGSRVEIIE